MKSDFDSDDLLNDVLGEVAPAAFRARLLEQTLREVRNRRRMRHLHRVMLATICLMMAVILVTRFVPIPAGPTAKANPLLVHSRPMTAAMVINTRPGTVSVVGRLNSDVAVVRSSTGTYRRVGDDELLALLAGRPAALVRRGPFEAELVFVNPDDRDGFPMQ